jgi:DMSO/TMAO reductase YedYZ molybdopterin-dependent catalytic subunit
VSWEGVEHDRMAQTAEQITLEELQLAARNHGMPLEALRYPVTPVGLHYLLMHYDMPFVEVGSWRLSVGGRVERRLELALEELRARPARELAVTMECAGNGRARLSPRPFSQPWLDEAVGTARWRGLPLAPLLREAGILDDAVEVVFAGLDRGVEAGVEQAYERSLPLAEALRDEVLLAYEVNGQPLPPQHGFPLRLVVPGWYGMTNVKWLTAIMVCDRPFEGHQQKEAYRMRVREDDEGVPLERMRPRAMMIPPGIPDFPSRRRTLPAGSCLVEGRAWSGFAPIERVDVSTDGGTSWTPAELAADVDSPWAWSAWRHSFEASPGEAELLCRATDAAGHVQPLEPEWNLGGYGNNAIQRVRLTVV